MQRSSPDTIHTMTSHEKNSPTTHIRVSEAHSILQGGQRKLLKAQSPPRLVQINPTQTDLGPVPREGLCHFLPLRIRNLSKAKKLENSLKRYWSYYKSSWREGFMMVDPSRLVVRRPKRSMSLINHEGQWGLRGCRGGAHVPIAVLTSVYLQQTSRDKVCVLLPGVFVSKPKTRELQLQK